jgi:hypothetical protein
MPELLTGDALFALFTEAERSIRRLSNRDRYDAEDEQDAMARFLAGEPDAPQWYEQGRAYFDNVTAKVAAGVRYHRVEVVPEPLTPYLRFDVWLRQYSVPAGEDVRYLARAEAARLHLPDHDFWTFDGERLVLLYFTADDRLIGGQLVREPAVVKQHEVWLDRAHRAATPWTEFVAEDPTRRQPPRLPA